MSDFNTCPPCNADADTHRRAPAGNRKRKNNKFRFRLRPLENRAQGRRWLRMRQSQHDEAPPLQNTVSWSYPLLPLTRPPQPGGASSTSTCHTTPPSTATVSSTGRHEKAQEPARSNNTSPSASDGLRHATISTPAAVPTAQEGKDRWLCSKGQSQHDQTPPLQDRGSWIYPLFPLKQPPQPGGASSASTCHTTPPSIANVSSEGQSQHDQTPPLQDRGPWIYPLRPLRRPPQAGGASSTSTCHTTPPSTATVSSNNTGPSSSGGLRHATITTPSAVPTPQEGKNGWRCREGQSQHDQGPPLQTAVSWIYPLLPLTRPPQPGGAFSASTSNRSTPPSTATVSSTGRHQRPQEPARNNNTGPSASGGLRHATVTTPAVVPTRFLAIDCEMVGAGPKGSINQLARCSIVSYEGDVVYDRFIKPPLPVTEYRTRWSGIRHRDLANAPPYAEARKEILRLLMGKVVIGHAIHNDFKVLRYSHPSVLTRDTSRMPLLNLKAGFAPNECASLKRLTKAIFNRDIQTGKKGHSSVEDARATMELYKVVEEEWERTLASRSQAS